MTETRNRPLPEGHRLPGYRLNRLLARGGFSFVYVAEGDDGATVAVKEYLPAALRLRTGRAAEPAPAVADAASFRHGLRRFFDEGRVLATLSHSNVVRVLNFFRAHETAYMVMRYEPGRTLKQRLLEEADGTLPEPWLRRTFTQLLNGLREVHARRLLHLDIKPANIYLREDGSPVLIDFGASRQMLGAENAGPPVVFTPGLASPELLADRARLGPWSDIYSVGATLYLSMFPAPPPPSTERLAADRYVPAREAGAGKYSPLLLDVVDWCLRLDPAQRPQSVLELQKALLESDGGKGRVPDDPKQRLRWVMGLDCRS